MRTSQKNHPVHVDRVDIFRLNFAKKWKWWPWYVKRYPIGTQKVKKVPMGTRSPERPFQWKVTLLGKMVFEWFENDLVRGLAKVGPINRIFSNWASVSHAKCQSLEKWSGYTVVLQGVFSHFLTQFISKTCDPLFLNKQHRIPAKLHPAFCCNPFE